MKLVCMGDSLTQGYGIALDRAWCNRLNNESDFEVLNKGISGDTTGGMLARFMYDVVDNHPTHVFIMGGTNDIFMGLSNNEPIANIYAMVHQAKHYGISFVIGIPTKGYLNLRVESEDPLIGAYREALETFCIEHEYAYIDMASGMKQCDFLEDGVHPNEVGHNVMLKNFIKGFKPFI